MTTKELARLVKLMKDKQKQWFDGGRSTETLRHSKDLERKVDKAVADALDERPLLPGMETA